MAEKDIPRKPRQIDPRAKNFKPKPRSADSPILPKQERFAQEYIKDLHAERAAQRAGYAPKHAFQTGHRLLRDPRVKKIINEHKAAASREAIVDVNWVLRQYKRLASVDIRGLYHPDGRLKFPHELDDDTAYAVASLETEQAFRGSGDDRVPITVTKAKRWDPVRPLDSIAKYLKMFSDAPQDDTPLIVKITGGLPDDEKGS